MPQPQPPSRMAPGASEALSVANSTRCRVRACARVRVCWWQLGACRAPQVTCLQPTCDIGVGARRRNIVLVHVVASPQGTRSLTFSLLGRRVTNVAVGAKDRGGVVVLYSAPCNIAAEKASTQPQAGRGHQCRYTKYPSLFQSPQLAPMPLASLQHPDCTSSIKSPAPSPQARALCPKSDTALKSGVTAAWAVVWVSACRSHRKGARSGAHATAAHFHYQASHRDPSLRARR